VEVGFRPRIDFGICESKAIHQIAGSAADVLSLLDSHHSESKLLSIVANVRGAEDSSIISGNNLYYVFPFTF